MLSLNISSDLAEVFRALGDPTRVRILDALAERERCVSDLAHGLGISEPAVSQHLRQLRQLHLVRGRRDGRMVFYGLDDDHVRVLLDVGREHVAERSGRAAAPELTGLGA